MAKSTVVPFDIPSEFSADPLTEVIQAGARELLRTAVQAEVSAFISEHAHLLDEEGRQRLVRHGFLPEREVMTGLGAVPVVVPRVRDRGANPDGTKIKFRSSLVPPYLRKAKSVEELLPWLYLKGIVNGISNFPKTGRSKFPSLAGSVVSRLRDLQLRSLVGDRGAFALAAV